MSRIVPMAIVMVMVALAITSLPLSQARVGYNLNVVVENTTDMSMSSWGRSQSTAAMNFQFEGTSTGNGESSKYIRIGGFAGLGYKENTYTNPGRLIAGETIDLKSDINYIIIDEAGDEKSDRYTAKINESLPILMSVDNRIYYLGDGIWNRNKYVNNDDLIYSNYHGKMFTKASNYRAFVDETLINVDITPYYVNEDIKKNSLTSFGVSSNSDRYSSLRYISADDTLIEGDYWGSFTINQKINKIHGFENDFDEVDWLECFLTEKSDPPIIDSVFEDVIFGCKNND